jgi:23S rRNA (uridine2552-2'-O)-methyltransferase
MRYNRQDNYYKKAKKAGYRSRAAYKLIELQQRFHVLRPGDLVVDLGAAPGGWLQIAAKGVAPSGKVIGVDLQRMESFREPNILAVHGDITSDETQQEIMALLGAPAHCVLSDLAPKLTGVRDTDTARCLELNQVALRVARYVLRPEGKFLIKSFISNDLHAFTAELKTYFRVVQRTRPEATRQGSSEFYFYATGFRGREIEESKLRA